MKKLTMLGEVRSFLAASKALSWSVVQVKAVSLRRRALRGSVVAARSLTNPPSWLARPKKDRSSVSDVGLGSMRGL